MHNFNLNILTEPHYFYNPSPAEVARDDPTDVAVNTFIWLVPNDGSAPQKLTFKAAQRSVLLSNMIGNVDNLAPFKVPAPADLLEPVISWLETRKVAVPNPKVRPEKASSPELTQEELAMGAVLWAREEPGHGLFAAIIFANWLDCEQLRIVFETYTATLFNDLMPAELRGMMTCTLNEPPSYLLPINQRRGEPDPQASAHIAKRIKRT